ncbi:MAG: adenosine kinase [Bacteroidota bacterium]
MSKTYNVYGIGNALVDLELKATDDFINEHNIQKGVMTLVDEETQFRLIEAISDKHILRKSGGSGANSIIAVAQFGGTAYYSCKVANDEYGDFYMRDMSEAGVATNLDKIEREQGITGKCLVMATEDAERTMNTFLGITTGLSTKEVNEEAIKAAEYVYLEGYPVTSPTGFEALKTVKDIAERAGVKTSLTLSDPAIVGAFKPKFEELLSTPVNLLFCNEEEAMSFTGKDTLAEAREALKEVAHHFAITQGKNGAIIFDGETYIDIEPYSVNVVDSLGAGDMFAGAFLYGITNNLGYAASGRLASKASSRVVAQYGPRLERDEVQQLLTELTQDV